jgi:hypothetical protein
MFACRACSSGEGGGIPFLMQLSSGSPTVGGAAFAELQLLLLQVMCEAVTSVASSLRNWQTSCTTSWLSQLLSVTPQKFD